jgi:hypothetical protein
MKKTLIIKELSAAIVMRVEATTARGTASKEIARFAKSGMGWCALGASGRYLLQHMMLDETRYEGSRETYDRLVALGVIEPMRVAA